MPESSLKSGRTPPAADGTVWETVQAAFRNALESPRYADLVRAAGVVPGEIISVEMFRSRVPVVRKSDLFRDDIPFHRLCRGGALGNPRAVLASSGFSGNNSFAAIGREQAGWSEGGVDAALNGLFAADRVETLVINALAMGVAVPTGHTYSATGPRPDLVLNVLGKFGRYFGQTIIIGDPHLLKNLVDDGNRSGVDWPALGVSFASGGDWMPETLRSYICHETDIDPDQPLGPRKYVQTMGLTEVGLLAFFETAETIRLRRAALTDVTLREALFGSVRLAVPSLFAFDPTQLYIEHLEASAGPELVFTTLGSDLLVPLIRYASGDLGRPVALEALDAAIGGSGRADLRPTLPLPLVWTAGRMQTLGEHGLRQDDMRHGLYSDIATARQLTGHFTVHEDAGREQVAVQLRKGVEPGGALTEAVTDALFPGSTADLPVRLYRYADYPFAMELSFEVKFNHQPRP